MVEVLCYKIKGCEFDSRWGPCIFSIYHILPAAICPWVDSASNRNEYQEDSWGVMSSQLLWLITLLPSVSELSTRCGSLDLSHPYGPSWPVTGTTLPFSFTLLPQCQSNIHVGAVLGTRKRVIMKQDTNVKTIGWPCVLYPVFNVTIWQPTSRGVNGDQGSTCG
jgi:hypothetical protein